ncbi:helix-turn-helix domain-containing protein [Streptomyces chrestomyceticus]|uniref:helix-turn-helix domain-containing protein n=1 Tax=Streptomyces chrestomyceticus TaxID=68185 RepID=UPI0033D2EF74
MRAGQTRRTASSCTVGGERRARDRRSWLCAGERDSNGDSQQPEDHGPVGRGDSQLTAEVRPLWHEQHQARLVFRPRKRTGGAGAKNRPVFIGWLLATVVRLRHVVTHVVLACRFGVHRSTVTRAAGEARHLLAERGCTADSGVPAAGPGRGRRSPRWQWGDDWVHRRHRNPPPAVGRRRQGSGHVRLRQEQAERHQDWSSRTRTAAAGTAGCSKVRNARCRAAGLAQFRQCPTVRAPRRRGRSRPARRNLETRARRTCQSSGLESPLRPVGPAIRGESACACASGPGTRRMRSRGSGGASKRF